MGPGTDAAVAAWSVRSLLASLFFMRVQTHAALRADAPPQQAATAGLRGSQRGRRRPASEPAPLRTPRVFISSRRQRHPILVVVVLVLLWATMLTVAATVVL